MRLLLSILLLSFVIFSFGQENPGRPQIEIYTGFDGGWWLYNVGSTDPKFHNTEGWERSYASPTFNLGLNLSWEIKRIVFGAGFDHSWFVENEMIGADHADGFYDLYPISDGIIDYWSGYGFIGYKIAQTRHFSMVPLMRIGGFQIFSEHPEQDNLHRKWYLQGAIDLNWEVKKIAIVFRPYFRSRFMKPKEGNIRESHTIVGFGGELGWRWTW
jgi:hypothetical protein